MIEPISLLIINKNNSSPRRDSCEIPEKNKNFAEQEPLTLSGPVSSVRHRISSANSYVEFSLTMHDAISKII